MSSNVTKDGDTTFTQFLYEGGQLVLELDESGVQTAFNVFGGESIISRMTAQVRVYYLYDGYGNVVQLTNTSGNVMTTYDYDAFGNMTWPSSRLRNG